MKLKYTIIGLAICLVLMLLFGSFYFITDPDAYCLNLHSFKCNIDWLVSIVKWIHDQPYSLAAKRTGIYILCTLPPLIGLMLDYRKTT